MSFSHGCIQLEKISFFYLSSILVSLVSISNLVCNKEVLLYHSLVGDKKENVAITSFMFYLLNFLSSFNSHKINFSISCFKDKTSPEKKIKKVTFYYFNLFSSSEKFIIFSGHFIIYNFLFCLSVNSFRILYCDYIKNRTTLTLDFKNK